VEKLCCRSEYFVDYLPQTEARTLTIWSGHNDEKISFSPEGERTFDHLFIVGIVCADSLFAVREV
jgi:hypothetical protein